MKMCCSCVRGSADSLSQYKVYHSRVPLKVSIKSCRTHGISFLRFRKFQTYSLSSCRPIRLLLALISSSKRYKILMRATERAWKGRRLLAIASLLRLFLFSTSAPFPIHAARPVYILPHQVCVSLPSALALLGLSTLFFFFTLAFLFLLPPSPQISVVQPSYAKESRLPTCEYSRNDRANLHIAKASFANASQSGSFC